jgi:hypothetical protein
MHHKALTKNLAYLCKVNKVFANRKFSVIKVSMFILMFLNEKGWVPFNVTSYGGKQIGKTSSFGDGPKFFKFKYPFPIAITLHIKSKHESWIFSFHYYKIYEL